MAFNKFVNKKIDESFRQESHCFYIKRFTKLLKNSFHVLYIKHLASCEKKKPTQIVCQQTKGKKY